MKSISINGRVVSARSCGVNVFCRDIHASGIICIYENSSGHPPVGDMPAHVHTTTTRKHGPMYWNSDEGPLFFMNELRQPIDPPLAWTHGCFAVLNDKGELI
jgi:hypothetical protein